MKIFTSVVLTMVLFLSACRKEASKPTAVSKPSVNVSVVQAVERAIPSTFQFQGFFVPIQTLEVKSETSGRVQGLSVTAGQNVSAGDTLLRIDNEQLPLILQRQQAELREAEAQQEYEDTVRDSQDEGQIAQDADVSETPVMPEMPPQPQEAGTEGTAEVPTQADETPNPNLPPMAAPEDMQARAAQRMAQIRQRALERQRLRAQQAAQGQSPNQTPQQAVQEDEAVVASRRELTATRIERLRTEIEITERQIASNALSAPIAGLVSMVKVSDGSLVQAGDVLLEIVVIDPMDLSLKIPKNQISRIQSNMNIQVEVPDLQLVNLKGEISFTDYEIKDQNSVEVRVRVSNSDGNLKKGMEGIAHLGTSNATRNALMIPRQALLDDGKQYYVFIHEGDQALRRPVQIGSSFEGMVEITQGLTKNDEVVLKGLDELRDETESAPVIVQ